MIFLGLPLLLNLWIFKILASSLLLFLLVIVSTLALHFSSNDIGKTTKPFIVFFALLLFVQFKTTQPASLTNLTNDQIRIRDMRLREYPPTYIKIGQRAKWFFVAEWFEESSEFRIFSRALNNVSQVLDPGLYYFANHPRERVGIIEFEKFPYLFLPFTAYGIIKAAKRKKDVYLLSFFGPLILLSIIGNVNSLGPFSLFPFVVLSTSNGLKHAFKILNKKLYSNKRIISITFLVLTLLILIQMHSYNVY